jgi:hypothetical protein
MCKCVYINYVYHLSCYRKVGPRADDDDESLWNQTCDNFWLIHFFPAERMWGCVCLVTSFPCFLNFLKSPFFPLSLLSMFLPGLWFCLWSVNEFFEYALNCCCGCFFFGCVGTRGGSFPDRKVGFVCGLFLETTHSWWANFLPINVSRRSLVWDPLLQGPYKKKKVIDQLTGVSNCDSLCFFFFFFWCGVWWVEVLCPLGHFPYAAVHTSLRVIEFPFSVIRRVYAHKVTTGCKYLCTISIQNRVQSIHHFILRFLPLPR